MSASNRPPVFSTCEAEIPRSGRTRLACSGVVGVGILFGLFVLLLAGGATQAADPGKQAVFLEFADGFQPTREQLDQLAKDTRWLTTLPAGMRTQPGPPGYGKDAGNLQPAPVDSLVGLRKWIREVTADKEGSFQARNLPSLLRDRWYDRGYLGAELLMNTGRADTVFIDPGRRFKLAGMLVEGEDFAGREQLLAIWLPRLGSDFDPARLQVAVENILNGAGELGYPYARWVTSGLELDQEAATLSITAVFLPGQRSWLGRVTTNLPPGRASDFLVRASGLRTGALFRQSDLERARQKLFARDLYNQVDEPLVYMTSALDTVGIHLPVVPRRKVNRIQVILGLSQRPDSGGNRLSGAVDLWLPNMAGTGRSFQIGWQDDGDQRSRFGFKYLEPLVFGTPLDTDLSVDNEVQRDSYTRFKFENNWRLPIVALWGVELGGGWDRTTYPVGSIEKSSRLRAKGGFLHRRGDPYRSGWSGRFLVERARRSSGLRSPEGESADGAAGASAGLGQIVSQQLYSIGVAGELWLGPAWSLAGRVDFRQLQGDVEVVPLAEHFRFGGARTLRGYQEDEFHGTEAAWGGLEVRVGAPGRSRLYTFYDLGYFEFLATDPLPEDPENLVLKRGWARGFGLGLLARTAGGDISLAVGFPGTVDFDIAKLHVTLLESF